MNWCFLFFVLMGSLYAKEMKILVLAVASDDKPYYKELQKVWRSYMDYDPEHVEAYFVKADPRLSSLYKIEDHTIWAKAETSVTPGIADKTILAMEAMIPRIKEFDFIVRTNLSSFFVFPRLLEFMKTLPKTGCYHACENKILQGGGKPYIPFGSGACFILSPDLVEMIVRNKNELLGSTIVDDVLFGWFCHYSKIPLIIATRMDILDMPTWLTLKNYLPENQYHFRLKNNSEHLRLTHEVQVHKELAKMFYGKHIRKK